MNKKTEYKKAMCALKKVIEKHCDIENAFFCSVGPVSLLYGTPGTPPNFKKGYGISHIIEKRDFEHDSDHEKYSETGTEIAEKMMDVIVNGTVYKVVQSKQCVHLRKDGYEAVVSLNWNGKSVNWLLTGWKII